MSKKTIALSLITILFLNGCSYIQSRFFESPEPISAVRDLIYNFIQPRREFVDEYTTSRLEMSLEQENDPYSYYSASGNWCRLLSVEQGRTACLIDGQWQASAPVLITDLP